MWQEKLRGESLRNSCHHSVRNSLHHRLTKLWLSASAKQRQNPCSGSPPVYQGLSTCHYWPVKNAIVDLPVRMKGNSNYTCGNSLSPLWAQNKNLGSASQKLLTEVKVRLPLPPPLSNPSTFLLSQMFPCFQYQRWLL